MRKLVDQAVGGLIEAGGIGVEVALLLLVLGLLVGVHEVAPTIAIALLLRLLCPPDLLLASLVGVDGLGKGGGRGGKGTAAGVLVVLVSVTAAEAKVELQPVGLLVVGHDGRDE